MSSYLKVLLGIVATCFVLVIMMITVAIFASLAPHAKSVGEQVAVIEIEGVLYDSTDILQQLEMAEERDEVKAVVIRINSPGGLVAPAEELYFALRKLDKVKPVVVSMGSVAASGGFYAAMGGRKVYANGGTLTASIGVIMEFMNAEGLYKWAKLKRFALKAGKLKDAGSTIRQMTPDERRYLQTLLDNIHQDFRKIVQSRRKLSQEELDVVADGRVMTGLQALEGKLVDSIGTLQDAISEAKSLAGLPEDAYVSYPQPEEGMLLKLLFGPEQLSRPIKKWVRFLESPTTQLPPLTSGWRILLLAPVH